MDIIKNSKGERLVDGVRVTITNPNSSNRLSRPRLRFWSKDNTLVTEMSVPTYNPMVYLQKHPNGVYGKEFAMCIEMVKDKSK